MALREWIADKNSNYGFVIKANLIERPDKELRMDDIGLVSSRGDDEFQPFMVGFFKGQEVNLLKPKFLHEKLFFNKYFCSSDDQAKTSHKTSSFANETSSRQSKSKEEKIRQTESAASSG